MDEQKNPAGTQLNPVLGRRVVHMMTL